MKYALLALLFVATPLLADLQVPATRNPLPHDAGEALPDNYVLQLTMTNKDAVPVEVSLVVASRNFQASLGEQGLTFGGSIAIDDAGRAVVAYQLGWQTTLPGNRDFPQVTPSSAQGSVRLKMGEGVEIISAGGKDVRLSVKKLDAAGAK